MCERDKSWIFRNFYIINSATSNRDENKETKKETCQAQMLQTIAREEALKVYRISL